MNRGDLTLSKGSRASVTRDWTNVKLCGGFLRFRRETSVVCGMFRVR